MENILKVTHNAGFFSCSTIRLRKIIDFYNQTKILPIVDSSLQWGNYKDKLEDVTSKFYKNTTDEKVFDFVKFSESDDEEQFSDYSQLNMKDISFFVKKYFTLSDDVINIKNSLINKYNINTQDLIGICYRGNDKSVETNVPTYNDMMIMIREVKQLNPEKRLLIQSDEKEFYNVVLAEFSDSIYFDEMIKINKNTNSSVPHHVPYGRKTEQAQTFLAILSILSECSKLIINSGNISMWICLYRENVNGVYQYLNPKEYIYGVKTKNYKVPDKLWLTF